MMIGNEIVALHYLSDYVDLIVYYAVSVGYFLITTASIFIFVFFYKVLTIEPPRAPTPPPTEELEPEQPPSRFVLLNVGGKKYSVARATILATESMLRRLVESPLKSETDADGHILIDRDGDTFAHVLNYLRDGKINFPNDLSVVKDIRTEADFYGYHDLSKLCNEHMDENRFNLDACRRAVYTVEERNALIAKKESIVFLCLGLVKNNTVGLQNLQVCVASSLVYFLRMPVRFPKFVYCIDYTESADLSFDFYTNGERINHICVYSPSRGRLENIEKFLDDSVQMVLNRLLELSGHGKFVEGNIKLAIAF